MNLTWIDVLVALFVGVGALRGYRRGLVREGMAFVGLAVGLLAAARWYAVIAEVLHPFVGGGRPADVLAFLLVLLAVLGCTTLVTVVLLKLRRLPLIGWLDRLGGAAFGGAQGALLAAIGLVLLVRYSLAGLDQAVAGSGIAVGLLRGVEAALANLPPEMAPVAAFFHIPKLP